MHPVVTVEVTLCVRVTRRKVLANVQMFADPNHVDESGDIVGAVATIRGGRIQRRRRLLGRVEDLDLTGSHQQDVLVEELDLLHLAARRRSTATSAH